MFRASIVIAAIVGVIIWKLVVIALRSYRIRQERIELDRSKIYLKQRSFFVRNDCLAVVIMNTNNDMLSDLARDIMNRLSECNGPRSFSLGQELNRKIIASEQLHSHLAQEIQYVVRGTTTESRRPSTRNGKIYRQVKFEVVATSNNQVIGGGALESYRLGTKRRNPAYPTLANEVVIEIFRSIIRYKQKKWGVQPAPEQLD